MLVLIYEGVLLIMNRCNIKYDLIQTSWYCFHVFLGSI